MDITLELDTWYHEGQKGKCHFQRKKPEASKSVSSHPQNSSSSNQKNKKDSHFQKKDKPHSPLLNKDFNLMGSEKGRIFKEHLCAYCVLITFNSDNKDYYDPSKSSSNDFPSSKSCEALGGDSRASSFPSSVHIPSFNSHQSLLSSRDEFFKDIQDFGEDNSVSSLNLFLWNVDLPPSSYHDSLEQLWDEEEEPDKIKTMMKVVTSAYHHYLDVFSKVTSERPPPHLTCDNHIELYKSLPPSGVIYSFSNQQSDTLRA
ncbi:hypothetical protein O181_013272 [Austropuccinia psidii MF-1]|uniref:Uncharacterized protein n=1 Tax=Austropuccinia psidii MF-1 TaxID=1389203 RepID=A0A9Q3BXZ9_9BASI|nr:hypothetical protein [Austropuccinia psidii MF-1]